MNQLLSNVLGNRPFFNINFIMGIIWTILFFVFYFGKKGRDERGRGIFSTACFVSMVALLILLYIYALWPNEIIMNVFTYTHALQILYNVVLFIHAIVTVILRKLR